MPTPPTIDNLAALEKTINALDGLTDEHAALIELARSLAHELDGGGEHADSKTQGEYRQVLKVLIEVGKKQSVDAFAEALRELARRT